MATLTSLVRHRVFQLCVVGFLSLVTSLSAVVQTEASELAASSVMQQAPDAGNSQPQIVCDVSTVADSIPAAPQGAPTTTFDNRLPAPGEAIEDTEIGCTGVEGQLQLTATWSEGSSIILQSITWTVSQPSQTYSDQETMYDGNWGIRSFNICVTASAPGFSSSTACNTLDRL